MTTDEPALLHVTDLRQAMADELAARRYTGEGFSFAEQRGGTETLYGITGAINIMAALGLPLGDRALRRDAATRMLRHRGADGLFQGSDGPGHAVHMVIAALNLLGEPVPATLTPLAPTDPDRLAGWLAQLDWGGTHKEFCGQTIPLVASGLVGDRWLHTLAQDVASRLDPAAQLETWCAADAPAWRVISCIYHVMSVFDAGRIPFPQPARLLRRLLDLRWDEVPDTEARTFCTDGDWAIILLRLCHVIPTALPEVMAAIRRVSARRVRGWTDQRAAILAASTHHLYCYLWSTAVFQAAACDHYHGGFIRDTFNDPGLMRLTRE